MDYVLITCTISITRNEVSKKKIYHCCVKTVLFDLDTKIYEVNHRTLLEYEKMRTRKKNIFAHFPHSVFDWDIWNLNLVHCVNQFFCLYILGTLWNQFVFAAQWRIQNPVKHRIWSALWKLFSQNALSWCLTRFWIRICSPLVSPFMYSVNIRECKRSMAWCNLE